ncbi:MAG TPA: hypothetical protein VGF17_25850 [Phytomonospora sp.]
MIRPEQVIVMTFAPHERGGRVWLSFDATTLVDVTSEQARVLTYELADCLGLFVCPRGGIAEAAE